MERQISEGTFGFFNKGAFRGNNVGTKHLKVDTTKDVIAEFTKDDALLDTFWGGQTIHFYGACHSKLHHARDGVCTLWVANGLQLETGRARRPDQCQNHS